LSVADVPKKCMKPHEECKDKYKGPVCNCEHGYKRKHGHCVGKKITDKHTLFYESRITSLHMNLYEM
jgi:hypothetical protein